MESILYCDETLDTSSSEEDQEYAVEDKIRKYLNAINQPKINITIVPKEQQRRTSTRVRKSTTYYGFYEE
jgi:hypothetical protein